MRSKSKIFKHNDVVRDYAELRFQIGSTWSTTTLANRSANVSIINKNILNYIIIDNKLKINLELIDSSKFEFSIFDFKGAKVSISQINSLFEKGKYVFEYDLNILNNGIYIINSKLNDEIINEKFSINH